MKFQKILQEPHDKTSKIWTIGFVVLGGILLTQLFIANVLASKGQELADLEARATKLSRDNSSRQEELTKKTSLISVSEKAKSLGLVKPDNIVYFDLSSSIAALPQ